MTSRRRDQNVRRNADYSGVSHVLGLEKKVFELRRRHLEAIHFDQLLCSELIMAEEISKCDTDAPSLDPQCKTRHSTLCSPRRLCAAIHQA
jgi:hypothetical protein